MRPRRLLPLASAALALSLALPARPAPAEETAPSPELAPPFVDRISVAIVNVEVYVTDRDGNPVPDLEREDFEVSEDGRPVEVVNFYRATGGRPAPAPPVAERPAPAAPPLPAPTREPEVPESQRLQLVVYVDNANLHPFHRNRVFGRLRAFLRDAIKPGDRVMVASYDRSLHVRHPFTGDPEAVNRVLLELEGVSGGAGEREAERAEAVKAIYEAGSLLGAQSRARQFAEAAHHELGRALAALGEMVDSLAGLPGRKMLLHVSDGLPMVPGQDLYQALQQRFADLSVVGEAYSRDMSRDYMALIARANSNRISFYTIDAAGLRTATGFGAENPTIATGHVVSSTIDAVHANDLQASLQLLAQRTGGQAILNTNDVGPGLARVVVDFDNYYSLGYRAPTEDRGRYHRIEVRLRDAPRGWTLRHREGYRDKPLSTQVADGISAFLTHGYETNPLGVAIDFGAQRGAGEGLVEVAIEVRIPIAQVLLVPSGGFHVGRLRLYLAAVDGEGREAPLTELPLELRVPAAELERARGDEVVRVFEAKMRPGVHRVVVGVRDEISEERSIVGRVLTVAARKPG